MAFHLQKKHGRSGRASPLLQPLSLTALREYRVAFTRTVKAIDFPVELFPERATSRTNLCLNAMHRHVDDIIVVLNKVPGPHPRYNKCYMFILQGEMATGHLGTEMCKRGLEKKRRHISTTTTQVAAGVDFRA